MATDKIKDLEKELKTLGNKSDKGSKGRKKVKVLNSIAGILLVSDPKRAKDYVDQALKLATKIDYKRGIHRCYLIAGILHSKQGHTGIALENYRKALYISKAINFKKGIAHAYTNIGTIHEEQGNLDMAMDCYVEALRIYDDIGEKTWRAGCYVNIGVIYIARSDFERALENMLNALRICEENKDKGMLPTVLFNIGTIYGEQKNHTQALKYLNRALDLGEKGGNNYIVQGCFSNLGRTYTNMANYAQALEYCLKALKMSEKLHSRENIAQSCIDIGRIYRKLQRYEAALSFTKRGLRIAHDIGHKQKERQGYQEMSELYKVKHDYKKALVFYEKYHKKNDELFDAAQDKQMTELKLRYETERKEREAEIHRLKNVELRREIKQRKNAERALENHRQHLAELVTERTSKLKNEISERKKTEQQLLSHQKQLRSLTREISLIEEKQRRKFATFLHDDISQALALATFKLRLVQESKSRKNTRKEIGAVKAIIDKTAERTRQLAFEISPPILYELGLEPALEWLVRRFGEEYKIKHIFKDDGLQKPLTDDASVFLFQSVRELLSNVAKHAHAKSVKVSAIRDGESIRIAVEDDGIGFSPKSIERKIRQNEGFGLFNIRERLRHLHGQMEVQSKRGQGTTMTLIAPLKRAARKKARK